MKITYPIEHFSYEEIACPCCDLLNINPMSIKRLDLLRSLLNQPIKINSACRCKKHNLEVGGALNSSHLFDEDSPSYAFDISCVGGFDKYHLIKKAMEVGFHRIGIYDRFIHLDDDPSKSPFVWLG